MGLWSFIDSGLQDFLRDDMGNVIKIKGTQGDAEEWLITEGDETTDWTNEGTRYWNWEHDDD